MDEHERNKKYCHASDIGVENIMLTGEEPTLINHIHIQNFTDIIKIRTDIYGKVLYLHSESVSITIKIK